MAELPSLVRVKRKRGDEPTADLFLEERTYKKQQVWQFRLQQPHPSQLSPSQSDTTQPQTANSQQPPTRREFRLARPSRPVHRRTESVKRKIQPASHDIPTFVEASPKRRRVGQEDVIPQSTPQQPASTSNTLKRPGASARLKKPTAESLFQSPATPPPDRLTDALHRFALEEEAREEARQKPKVTVIPKKPVQRYRDRHPEEFAAQQAQEEEKADKDIHMSDDEDYVYDTYIRTKVPVVPFQLDSEDPANVQVGYIVISEEDQPLWETYFEEEGESDKEFETDDEDENAEGYYAADYPEDEVASDDEFDRGAYGYRHGGSDDEQWESDPEDWSEGEDAMQNPWKKYPWMRSSRGAAGASDDDDDEDS